MNVIIVMAIGQKYAKLFNRLRPQSLSGTQKDATPT